MFFFICKYLPVTGDNIAINSTNFFCVHRIFCSVALSESEISGRVGEDATGECRLEGSVAAVYIVRSVFSHLSCEFYASFPRFAGLDVLIRCMSTNTRSLSKQTACWGNSSL